MLCCIGRCSRSSNRSASTDWVKRLAGEDTTIVSECEQRNATGQPVRVKRGVFENEHATQVAKRFSEAGGPFRSHKIRVLTTIGSAKTEANSGSNTSQFSRMFRMTVAISAQVSAEVKPNFGLR